MPSITRLPRLLIETTKNGYIVSTVGDTVGMAANREYVATSLHMLLKIIKLAAVDDMVLPSRNKSQGE
jgi:hypothetical protein